jgi:anti-sigma factor ChrR (cupin superfamily)
MLEQPNKERLAAAAEALVEAASLEADAATHKQLAQNLDALKTSFASNLNRVVHTVKSSNENFHAKINTLNQNVQDVKNEIVAMKNEIVAMKALLEEERKQKTLERALNLTHLGSFEYSNARESSDLAKKVIDWFMLGYGVRLPSNATVDNNRNEDFYEKFKGQMKVLIKREPRLVKEEDGSYFIYYS